MNYLGILILNYYHFKLLLFQTYKIRIDLPFYDIFQYETLGQTFKQNHFNEITYFSVFICLPPFSFSPPFFIKLLEFLMSFFLLMNDTVETIETTLFFLFQREWINFCWKMDHLFSQYFLWHFLDSAESRKL